jgi:hypothetical protein
VFIDHFGGGGGWGMVTQEREGDCGRAPLMPGMECREQGGFGHPRGRATLNFPAPQRQP